MYETKRTNNEINEQLNLAADGVDQGSKFPGMSYEQGVENAINWLIGNDDSPPMED
jgi:hypothetical protein